MTTQENQQCAQLLTKRSHNIFRRTVTANSKECNNSHDSAHKFSCQAPTKNSQDEHIEPWSLHEEQL